MNTDTTEKISVPNLSLSEKDKRRTGRWIDPDFQKRYAFLLVSVVLLISAVLVGTFWYHSQQVLQTLVQAGVVKEHQLYALMETQMSSLLWSVYGVVILFAIFIFVMATFLSHRIVGPLFAIKRSLEAIVRGDFDGARLTLRADDEFQDVADLINKVVDKTKKG